MRRRRRQHWLIERLDTLAAGPGTSCYSVGGKLSESERTARSTRSRTRPGRIAIGRREIANAAAAEACADRDAATAAGDRRSHVTEMKGLLRLGRRRPSRCCRAPCDVLRTRRESPHPGEPVTRVEAEADGDACGSTNLHDTGRGGAPNGGYIDGQRVHARV